MAKKRNSKTVRPQDYPDADDFSYSRDKMQNDFQAESEAPVSRPVKAPLDWKGASAYREGAVVTIAESQLLGTVVACVGRDLMVLDSLGIIHMLQEKDVYQAQQ